MSSTMKCEQVQELTGLYLYGELTGEVEEAVEQHCSECAACQAEVSRERAFAATLDSGELEVSRNLLADCRSSLAARLREEPVAQSWWQRLLGSSVAFRVPVGAMALMAIGYFGAKLTPSLLTNEAGMVSTVRSVEPEAQGRVRISVDDLHRRVVSGDPDDRNIRELLIAASRDEENAGVRVESVGVLKDMAGSADVRSALLDVVQHDPNPGVRLKALEGLKQFCSSDAALRKTLAQVLVTDTNPGVRIQVIDLLVKQRDDSMVGVMQHMVGKEDDSYVRMRLERALRDMNASVGTF